MECLYVNFIGLQVSVIHLTIIRSVRAKEIVMQQRSTERNGIPLCFSLFIHMTIITSVRAKEIVMQQRSPERNGIPLSFILFSMMDIEL
jgi:hypothetical protein